MWDNGRKEVKLAVLTRFQAREIDRIAMHEIGLPGLVLMENAARGVADAVLELRPFDGPVALVCGPGNNGGDGLAAARILSNADVVVRIIVVAGSDPYPPESDASVHLRVARKVGLSLAVGLEPRHLEGCDIVVDALFGTGLDRALSGPFLEAVEAINAASASVVAVDIPSGLDADTGTILGDAVKASITATMVAPKAGFFAGEGPAHTGRIRIVDIGVPPALVERIAAGP